VGVTLRIPSRWRSARTYVWRLEGDAERNLREAIVLLRDDHRADRALRTAVVVVREDDDTLVGAWNRRGADDLARIMISKQRGDAWVEIYGALRDVASYPLA
jgi:hypothetical protein